MSRVTSRWDQELGAWRSARSFAILYAFGAVLTLIGTYLTGVTSVWQWFTLLFVSVVCLGLTTFFRNMPSAYSITLFLFNTAALFLASIVSNHQMAQSKAALVVSPFAAMKLLSLTVAVMAPKPIWTGYSVIMMVIIVPTIHVLLLPQDLRDGFSQFEPWYTIVYGTSALGLLHFRLLNLEHERQIVKLRSERKALDELARIFLAVRDLTNTPLQALVLTTSLLESEDFTKKDAIPYLQLALARLQKLTQILKSYEKNVDWSVTDASFDAVEVLERKLAQVGSEQQIQRSPD